MNTYETEFFAICPSNGMRVKYHLAIATETVIPVEQIVATVEAIDTVFHEEIADALHSRYGGYQTLVAEHHSVKITTKRGHATKGATP